MITRCYRLGTLAIETQLSISYRDRNGKKEIGNQLASKDLGVNIR